MRRGKPLICVPDLYLEMSFSLNSSETHFCFNCYLISCSNAARNNCICNNYFFPVVVQGKLEVVEMLAIK